VLGLLSQLLTVSDRKDRMMILGGKKRKMLKLAGEYASKKSYPWELFYDEMSGLLK
jgi:hypothetical protein